MGNNDVSLMVALECLQKKGLEILQAVISIATLSERASTTNNLGEVEVDDKYLTISNEQIDRTEVVVVHMRIA